MAYDDATLVANNVLDRAFRDNIAVSPMKLQKILYFVASEYAKATGEALFEEHFEAWVYGPTLRSVHRVFKPFEPLRITKYAMQDAVGKSFRAKEASDPHLRVALDAVWAVAKDKPTQALYRLTLEVGSGWEKAREKGQRMIDPAWVREDATYQRALLFPPYRPAEQA